MNDIFIIAIPFLGTTLGAAMVFFMKSEMNSGVEKLLLGFASGVMIAASVWSLLIPAIEMAEEQRNAMAWLPATVGFLMGMGGLFILNRLLPLIRVEGECTDAQRISLKKTTMLVLAVTIHNLPEGMAMGVIFAGAKVAGTGITMASVFVLAVGIGIQNFPEGAIISMPLRAAGASRKKAFLYGFLSGVVEPIGSIITILLAALVVPVLPYFLAFAAGAMVYVVVEELIPEFQENHHGSIGTIGVAFGFALMMILDVALG